MDKKLCAADRFVIHDGLAICIDCLVYVSNRKVLFDGHDITPEHREMMNQRWPRKQIDNMHHSCTGEGECGWFSWSECDGCGATLGGERHSAVVLGSPPSSDEETATRVADRSNRCEGHYDDDYALLSGVGVGEPVFCDGSCAHYVDAV